MAAKEVIKIINRFYGGIVRDDKSGIVGSASNIEELDIFSNADYIQAEQILSSYSLPASTEAYAYDSGDDDTVYAYGKETSGNKVRILSVASGGGTNPSTLATLFTSGDTTNLATQTSDLKFFRTVEASNPTSLYFIKGTSTSWYISRYNIGAAAEQRWTGSAWSGSGSWDSNSQLTGLTGSFMRPTKKVIFGELFICNGRYIAKIDKDGVFTEKAFTLPQEWESVDIIAVSDVAVILCRNKNKLVNHSKAFWWDLTTTSSFDDSFVIPMGGPQWIFNHKETIKILTAINGTGRIWQMSGAFPGAVPLELPGILIKNLATETSTNAISFPKTVGTKDKILYFGLWKTDKTGLYAVGQLDSDKPNAFILSKRYHTTDYSLHKPIATLIQGPNFYVVYDDNGTNTAAICKTLNSPNRSTSAVYESIYIDEGQPLKRKDLTRAYVTTQPLPSGTSVDLYVEPDFSGSYTQVKRADNTIFNTANGLFGLFRPAAFTNKYAFRVKVVVASSGSNSPKLQAIGLRMSVQDVE